MTDSRPPEEHLTSYERAVSYYALPKVIAPVTFGLLIAYVICLVEAVALLAYGVLQDDASLTRWGLIAVAVMIGFGVLAFLGRAFLNDVRQRQLLKGGEMLSDHDFDRTDVPDPLADNVLLCYSLRDTAERAVKDNDGIIQYIVTRGPGVRTRTVSDASGAPVLTLQRGSGLLGFGLNAGIPSSMAVYRGPDKVANLRRRITVSDPVVRIETLLPSREMIVAKGRSLYKNDALIGRVYFVRHFAYLDMERDHFHDGVLAFFIAVA